MVSRNDFKFTLFADDSLSDAMSAYKDLGRRKGQRYQAMLVFIAAGFTSHFLFIFLFYFLGAGALSWLNVLSSSVWALAFYYSYKQRHTIAVLLAMCEIMVHALLACLSLGLGAGFQVYLWTAIALVVMMPDISLRHSILLAVLPLLLLSILSVSLRHVAYPFRYPEYIEWINQFNILSAGAALIFAGVNLRQENNKQRQRLLNLASHDELTKLYNRRFGRLILDRCKQMAERNKQPFCVAMADIDYFKRLNDTFGHDAGDAVLRSVASCFQSRLRKSDTICRWGGEEFLILLGNTTQEGAYRLVESLRLSIASMRIQNMPELPPVSISFGLARFVSGETIDNLIIRADTLLYLAKEGGRNQTVSQPPGKDAGQVQ